MKTKHTQSLLTLGLAVTAFMTSSLQAAVVVERQSGHNTLVSLTSTGAYNSVAPADTSFAPVDGTIHSHFVFRFSDLVTFSSLMMKIDKNKDGDFTDPGDVFVDFTSSNTATLGTSPTYELFDLTPGLATLGAGVDLTGGGPFRVFVVSNHLMGDYSFETEWSGTAVSSVDQSVVNFSATVSNAVPEPATTLLGAFGILGLLRRRRK